MTDWTPVEILRAAGRGPVVLVCEHASKAIPAELDELGLVEPARSSHAVWDIGAREVAAELSAAFDAPLVAGGLSRLVYDLNRPPEAPDAIPEKSEVFDIPGNRALNQTVRRQRFDRVHEPFHKALADLIRRRAPAALVTVHSFTPVYNGKPRKLELGFLHDATPALARAALAAENANGRYAAALNAPYAASDGVTYTLKKHGEAQGLPALMIEIRNDLIDTGDKARAMAAHLKHTLARALETATPGEAAR